MKSAIAVPLLLALCSTLQPVACTQAQLSPITRVVDLLKGLSAKMEEEGKMEENLYEKFVCWAKTIVDSKTASNAAAKTKIGELEAYIAQLDGNKIELTSERTDLEKEIEELEADIQEADDMRSKEAGEFSMAKDEMEKAIVALGKAIDILGTATQDNTGGVLLSMRAGANEGFAARAKEAASLQQAVDLGAKFLTKGDALFLRRLLTGDVPDVDWKKLNRKATFKMSYKARSFKIQDVLKQLKATFEENLSTAIEKENTAIAEYNTLSSAKQSQLNTATDAKTTGADESGAKALSRSDSQGEVDRLNTEITNDLRFISETTASLAEKKQEWKDRQLLRAGEQEAIAKAIEILHNDDARDNFKKSFASQNLFFLQTSEASSVQKRAAAALRETGHNARDYRLVELSKQLTAAPAPAPGVAAMDRNKMDGVITSIESMISTLNTEMENDLTQKESCEKERAEDARTAILAGRKMDEQSQSIMKLEYEIAELGKQIEEAQAELKNERDEMAEATKLRGEQNREWLQTDADDKLARDTVIDAKGVLEKFYSDNGLVLTQVAKKQPAGEAPPPPPKTWEEPYGGKTGESSGIIAILGMIQEDIVKDINKAKTEEDEAESAYQKQKATFESTESSLMASIATMKGTQGGKLGEVSNTKGLRTSKKGELDGYMKTLKDKAEGGCDFMTINYASRLKNRQFEIDGLNKAKAIMEGASFGGASFLAKK